MRVSAKFQKDPQRLYCCGRADKNENTRNEWHSYVEGPPVVPEEGGPLFYHAGSSPSGLASNKDGRPVSLLSLLVKLISDQSMEDNCPFV
jgi:hypothetical protein